MNNIFYEYELEKNELRAREDHMIVWLFEESLKRSGIIKTTIETELQFFADNLMILRNHSTGLILNGSKPDVLVDVYQHIILLGDRFYELNLPLAEEVMELYTKFRE